MDIKRHNDSIKSDPTFVRSFVDEGAVMSEKLTELVNTQQKSGTINNSISSHL